MKKREVLDHRKIISESMNHSWNEFLQENVKGTAGWEEWGLDKKNREAIVNKHQAAADARPGVNASEVENPSSDLSDYEQSPEEESGDIKNAVQVIHHQHQYPNLIIDIYRIVPPHTFDTGFAADYMMFHIEKGEPLKGFFAEIEKGGDPSDLYNYAAIDSGEDSRQLKTACKQSDGPEQVLDIYGYRISDDLPSETPTAQASTAQGSETVYDKFKKDELRRKEKMKGKKYGNPYGENEFGGYFPEE